MIELTGQIERVKCFDEVPGFTVARLRIDRRRTPVTAVGRLLDPRPGEMLAMTGGWTIHPNRLSPMHRGAAGADGLNRVLQETLKPGSDELMRGIGPSETARQGHADPQQQGIPACVEV